MLAVELVGLSDRWTRKRLKPPKETVLNYSGLSEFLKPVSHFTRGRGGLWLPVSCRHATPVYTFLVIQHCIPEGKLTEGERDGGGGGGGGAVVVTLIAKC